MALVKAKVLCRLSAMLSVSDIALTLVMSLSTASVTLGVSVNARVNEVNLLMESDSVGFSAKFLIK